MRPDNTLCVYATERVTQAQHLIPLVEDRCNRKDRHFNICHDNKKILFCIQGPFYTKRGKQIIRYVEPHYMKRSVAPIRSGTE